MYSWDNAQVVLVGNKCDLEHDRAVTQERGKRLADQLGNKSIDVRLTENVCKTRCFCLLCFVLSCVVLCCSKGSTDKNTFVGENTSDINWK